MSPLFELAAPLHRVLRGLYAGCTLARVAYYERPSLTNSVKAAIHGEGFTKIRFQHPYLPMIDIWRMREGVIVVFEGTRDNDSERGLYSRLIAQRENTVQAEFPNFPGRVGDYWGTMLNDIWPEIELYLGQTGRTNTVFIGHSLGGVLALLAAHKYNAIMPFSVVGVMTFGMPRAGNEAFRTGTPFTHWRLFNREDIVPDLPPEHLLRVILFPIAQLARVEYRHHGKSVSFNSAAHMFLNDGESYYNREGVSPLATFAPNLSIPRAHSPGEYVRRIRWQFWRGVSNEETALDELNNALNIEDGSPWRIDRQVGDTVYRFWNGPASDDLVSGL